MASLFLKNDAFRDVELRFAAMSIARDYPAARLSFRPIIFLTDPGAMICDPGATICDPGAMVCPPNVRSVLRRTSDPPTSTHVAFFRSGGRLKSG